MPSVSSREHDAGQPRRDNELRIIGGSYRGRVLAYHGDPVTRPMKHRVREAIFNLVSTESAGRQVFDVFAGTGALGLEALSRGATHATFVERHVPTSRIVRENIESLGVEAQSTLIVASAFVWGKRDLPVTAGEKPSYAEAPIPWLVFVSPPYALFVEKEEEMLSLIQAIADFAPLGSTIVVESDNRFNVSLLPNDQSGATYNWRWDVRQYPPAVIAVGRKLSFQSEPQNRGAEE